MLKLIAARIKTSITATGYFIKNSNQTEYSTEGEVTLLIKFYGDKNGYK